MILEKRNSDSDLKAKRSKTYKACLYDQFIAEIDINDINNMVS